MTRHKRAKPKDASEKLGRASLLWMLHETGITFKQLGEIFGFSGEYVRRLCLKYGRLLGRRALATVHDGSQLSARLVQAGAAFPANGPIDNAARRAGEMDSLLVPRDIRARR